jgi:hypothetical protein
MGISHRLRTELGINKTINFEIQQEFDFLEILSLKIQQEDIYPKSCADYGVVVGRITANNGYGIPNAKVSIFVPIDPVDESNPVITSIYPYKTTDQKNEDGYRYNLLPYEQSYSRHSPTGTFPTALDALTDDTAIQIYDKYYKYVVKTNESGDYMIMGVPLGIQTVFLDLDLSDIGEFSLTPQDLIRMGLATEAQVSGPTFKSSSNLDGLPQIVSLTKSIDVAPLWGDRDICQIAISRCDFDLRDDANIDIQPTAVFMGSIVSSIDTKPLRIQCKPATEMGNMCNLVAGPGQIISIRQTIFDDEFGRPILEQFNFDGGNDVIDSDGAWLVDLPMNLDYVSINEFGERVFSDDPKIGIPTKAKYRFKIKWKQPETLDAPIKRGYFLVPNIREYGWVASGADPRLGDGEIYKQFEQSYAFSLDWNDYGSANTILGRKMIQSAIDCEDKFFEFQYNKVYTVAGLIDLYHKGTNRGRFIGIKQITDTTCDSTNYKFPTNDAVRNFDIIFVLINFLVTLNSLTFFCLIPMLHVVATTWEILKPLVTFVFLGIAWPFYGLCLVVRTFFNVKCTKPLTPGQFYQKLGNPFKKIKIPMITYPDCDLCECRSEELEQGDTREQDFIKRASEGNSVTLMADFQNPIGYSNIFDGQMCIDDPFIGKTGNTEACNFISNNGCNGTQASALQELMSGSLMQQYWRRTPAPTFGTCTPQEGVPYVTKYHSIDLTLAERMNLFNLKGKYFNTLPEAGVNGGQNQIRVSINPEEPGNQTFLPNSPRGTSKFHYDNTLVMITDQGTAEEFIAGKLLTFTTPEALKDINLSGQTVTTYLNENGEQQLTISATGTPKNLSTITVNYADPNFPEQTLSTTYVVNQNAATNRGIIPQTGGRVVTITSSWNGDTANPGVYTNLTGTTLSEGTGATFNLTITTANQIPDNSIVLNNVGYNYEAGESIIIRGSLIGGQDVLDDIEVVVQSVSEPQIQNIVVQKFATDTEYYQVITATTYNEFITQNPTVPVGPNFIYNNPNDTRIQPFYKSLKYRYTDNFQVIWQSRLERGPEYVADPKDGCTGLYEFARAGRDVWDDNYLADIQHNIWNLPDAKNLTVVIMVRGVDPHSARQDIQYDLSRLYGYDYGNVLVRGSYKLNIPIQPGLVLPRHDEIANTDSGSAGANGRGVFFESYVYNTTSSFSAFSSNLIANYSAFDKKCLTNFNNSGQRFRVDTDSKSTLQNEYLNTALPYAGTESGYNFFTRQFNQIDPGLYFYERNGITNNTSFGDINNKVKISTREQYDKSHRGYYDGEYLEGGSMFYNNIDLEGPRALVDTCEAIVVITEEINYADFVYFSPVYNTATTVNFLAETQKIVMRTDRLPTSSSRDDGYGNNTFIFHQNIDFNITFLEDDGTAIDTYPDSSDGFSSGDNQEDELSEFEEKIVGTFSCPGLVPLNCYEGSGQNFGVKPIGDDCYGKPATVRDGCYVFVDQVIISLLRDYVAFQEWKTRFRVNLAACRGVFSHTFVNNWVNGTLFAFPIKNKRLFDSSNKPFNKFCKDVVVLHPPTNNFYYRSSPYNGNSNRFIGFAPNHPTKRNKLQLQFPTTLMDLGPRDEFSDELSCSTDFLGYNMRNIPQTSYQDISNILNLFIISRQISASFISQLLSVGGGSVDTFFSRRKSRVDGDYAQAISISSELAVEDFDFENYNYSFSSPNNSFYVNDRTMGIFFSSNTQTRDFISPKRIIRNDNSVPGLYDNFPVFTQKVPTYKWFINNENSIFGNQKNDWATSRNQFTVEGYQSLDRLSQTSGYYKGGVDIPTFQKGYIYNVVPAPNSEYYFQGSSAGQNLLNGNLVTVGVPYHFYFGLVRGNSAMDKFNKKYLGLEIL